MSRSKAGRLGVLVLLAAATVVAFAAPGRRHGAGAAVGESGGGRPALARAPNGQPEEGERPECPLDSVVLPRYVEKRLVGYEWRRLTMPGPITDIQEFHDCQRFVTAPGPSPGTDTGPRFDSLYAIFASFRLDTLLVPRAAPLERAAVTGATIYSWEGTYEPLHIRPRFNCLYLWWDQTRDWQAYIVHAGDSDSACAVRRGTRPAGAEPLAVRVVRTGFSAGEIPAVARWDWDPKRRTHFIGIRCGAAWCEVGGDTLSRSATPAVSAGMSRARRRVRLVKGWHDQQWVAARPPGATGPLPSAQLRPFRGYSVVIPDPKLGDRTDGEFRGGWVPVATVFLSRAVPRYKRKFNFARGTNAVWLKHTDTGWTARIQTATGETEERRVIRRDHSAAAMASHIPIPATARWRWMRDDETIWARCLEGCCEVQSGDS